jgi:hypothetical protein
MDLNYYDIEQLLSVNWDLSEDDLDNSDLENGLGSDDEIVYDINIDEHLEGIFIYSFSIKILFLHTLLTLYLFMFSHK